MDGDMIKKYIVFAWDDHYPAGGLGDMRSSHETLEEARAVARRLEALHGNSEIIDRDTWEEAGSDHAGITVSDIMQLLDGCKWQERGLQFRRLSESDVAAGAIPYSILSKADAVLFEARTLQEIAAYLTGFQHAP